MAGAHPPYFRSCPQLLYLSAKGAQHSKNNPKTVNPTSHQTSGSQPSGTTCPWLRKPPNRKEGQALKILCIRKTSRTSGEDRLHLQAGSLPRTGADPLLLRQRRGINTCATTSGWEFLGDSVLSVIVRPVPLFKLQGPPRGGADQDAGEPRLRKGPRRLRRGAGAGGLPSSR